MKKKFELCRILCPCLGLLALLLGLLLNGFGYDEKGFLKPGFFVSYLLPVLAVAGCVLPALLLWPFRPKAKYSRLFPASPIGGASIACGALGIAVSSIPFLSGPVVSLICGITGLLSGVTLGIAAWFRFRGKRPTFLLFMLPALHLMLRLLCEYMIWSREPQILRFLFPLLALAAVSFSVYQQTAADAGFGSLRHYTMIQLSALTLSLGAVASADWFFYLTMSGWLCLNLASIRLPNTPYSEQGA